ncbi:MULTISPECIES: KilA-N domain-containing protein [unclassified Aurantimonas]|uniref:KilA-N domain-containing protein n=1 Tax=unclassified Aurantimonas TaxID=2638230 RepID=UPI002E1832C9|nr:MULTISPECIES: KilA-N domain-containing protein [unclassified Aurantimonas]MEC5289377.1 KilA-N domain-containing protein [Aurantimonas sp. C2-3-R2]MEC5410457.1 KilA-N domain-containing protein [Aurantimonas sp. C2-4-R8]
MTATDIAKADLIYNGEIIHAKAETLSLTDMWKAAGSPANRDPGQWQRLSQAAEFIEHVSVIMGIPHDNLVTAKKRGGTWANWQIGLAYAKYLSPEFHMWCNTVVRAVMEGRAAATDHNLTKYDMQMIGNAVKNCAGVAVRDALAIILPSMVEKELASNARVAALEYVSVRELLEEAKALMKGRGRVNRKIGWELRSRALLRVPPIQLRRCPHSGVWLFPRDFAMAYMGERGNKLVREHNDKASGQGVLRLVGKAGKPANH